MALTQYRGPLPVLEIHLRKTFGNHNFQEETVSCLKRKCRGANVFSHDCMIRMQFSEPMNCWVCWVVGCVCSGLNEMYALDISVTDFKR